jgi:hypothetical protein
LPLDDAGHVIGNRFGGRADHNAPNGNIFPQDLVVNRGLMNQTDRQSADRHSQGCDVCVHISLQYASPGDLRPSSLVYTRLVRTPGSPQFGPPVPIPIPNP